MNYRGKFLLLAFALAASAAVAQVVPQPGPPTSIACAFNVTPPTLADTNAGWIQCDGAGRIIVSAGTGAPPPGAISLTNSATGTTLATVATLPAGATTTTYICGFSIRANATAAATGNATVAGTISGTLNFTQWTAPLASGIGTVEHRFEPCLPASAVNTTIVVTSAAPGAGGIVSATAWGYRQ